jgi:hypothetical protein
MEPPGSERLRRARLFSAVSLCRSCATRRRARHTEYAVIPPSPASRRAFDLPPLALQPSSSTLGSISHRRRQREQTAGVLGRRPACTFRNGTIPPRVENRWESASTYSSIRPRVRSQMVLQLFACFHPGIPGNLQGMRSAPPICRGFRSQPGRRQERVCRRLRAHHCP